MNSLFPTLNRPQYVATPEAFVSAMAWRGHTWSDRSKDGTAQGLMYRQEESGSTRLKILSTYPDDHQQLLQFHAGLSGFTGDSGLEPAFMARAFADSVLGIRSEKGKMQPAAPMTRGLALLQDIRGYQRTKNPPDLGLILEQLYQLGLPAGQTAPSPAQLWLSAVDEKTQGDKVLRSLDEAIHNSLLPDIDRVQVPSIVGLGDGSPSPFSWFVSSWDALTSREWWSALPARVWVDWCSSVLRLALGLGFLWEANWYDLYARSRISGKQATWHELNKQVGELIPWAPSDAQVGVRDVASLLKGRVRKGDAVRKLLSENPEASTSEIKAAWDDPGTAGTNVWESIRYALKTRDQSGRFADHFGLLTQSGRYLYIDPGTEWIVVVASLASGGPGRVTDARTVMRNLREMGLRPELRDLVLLLEAAGLARGSADADYGLEVHSAY